MRIGIVNDVALACEALRRVVESGPGMRVAWLARDGVEAVHHARVDRPDLILMDLVMPRLNGVEATRQIMEESPCPIVVVTSSVSGNIGMVYEAMGLGAVDAVDTPRLGAGGRIEGDSGLLEKICRVRKLTGLDRLLRQSSARGSRPAAADAAHRRANPIGTSPGGGASHSTRLVLIGASTGGPAALAKILEDLPADLPAAVVIAQHVDRAFAGGLVHWLAEHSAMSVGLARAGQWPQAGRVVVADTNDHLVIAPNGMLDYTDEPRDQSFRPSIDVLFESALSARLEPGIAVLLTGMGRDGAAGMLKLRQKGWHTIAQDQATSVVYGMPKAAAEMGSAVEVLPMGQIGRAVTRKVRAMHAW